MHLNNSPIRVALTVFLQFLTPAHVQAELLECTDCCKSDGVSNITSTTFQSNITSDGVLAWSMTSSLQESPNDRHLKQYWRDFYLNTPPSLNLSNITSFSGCSLFFYNATAALQIASEFNDYRSFSCDTLMSTQCQEDFKRQASDDLALLLNPNNGLDLTFAESLNLCGTLASRSANRSVPESCSFAGIQPTWGYATGRDVAGSDLALGDVMAPGELNCSFAIDKTYNTFIAESTYVAIVPGSEEAKAFQNGTTPVLTVFFSPANQTQGSQPVLLEPELHLSCLKSVLTEEELKAINNGIGHIPPVASVLMVGAVATILLIGI